ncbi:hypothetical protein M409DRAFT_50200 [Zasmidium cellare ATCC 36951]|uniref:Extracellular membrane protein CFEM domain-containing protein n=1 Tax=Zasmidium cellare ATCC 36951 TaxID=1080233 RepID=A0A6A6D008_ZASCE|nr:uncharacterized protein M409DRAFT_50200 [Zasmidium cellare ATCC 36951]KAF2172515.1 hypothetical protein M409DRAFT_50200 [Zasmidium cellare ATCC 36951]
MIRFEVIFTALLLATRLTLVLGALPQCLSACSTISATPCTPDSLPALISCLNDHCSFNNTLSTYAVALSPKIEYSCQQSYVPGDDTPTTVLKMTGQGQCMTSPYDFRSFVTSAGNNPWASGVCRIFVYPEADCAGHPEDLALMLHSEGFSRRYVEQMCLLRPSNGNNDTTVPQTECNPAPVSLPSNSLSQSYSPLVISSVQPLDSPSTWILPSGMPISHPNSTSRVNATSRLISSSPTETAMAYLGGAVKESKDATIAAMFALIAAFILL